MSSAAITRKPLPQPAQAHLRDNHNYNVTAASSYELDATAHGQDAPSTQQMQAMETGKATPSNGGSTSEAQESKGKQHAIAGGFLASMKASTFGSTASRYFNNILPPHKRYFNNRISRRTLLIMIGAVFISLLALIIGLAAGLSHHSDDTALPLPGGAKVIQGDLTYYNPALGACGETHGDGDAVVAVSHIIWDAEQSGSNPNTNPLCGRRIRARRFNEKTGKDASIDVTVIDRCTGCAAVDIDVSPAMFDKMADPAKGRVTVEWTWL